MMKVKKCKCGRSETGICDGSHSLPNDEYNDKKSSYVASTLAEQFPGSIITEEIRVLKGRLDYSRPPLDLGELDAFIHKNFS